MTDKDRVKRKTPNDALIFHKSGAVSVDWSKPSAIATLKRACEQIARFRALAAQETKL